MLQETTNGIAIGSYVEYETDKDEVFEGEVVAIKSNDVVIIQVGNRKMPVLAAWCMKIEQPA